MSHSTFVLLTTRVMSQLPGLREKKFCELNALMFERSWKYPNKDKCNSNWMLLKVYRMYKSE